MGLPHDLEISSDDPAALLVVFVNGREAAMGNGRLVVPVRSGQHVRWFARPTRRSAGLLVTENRNGKRVALFDGKCDPVASTEAHAIRPLRAASRPAAKVVSLRTARPTPRSVSGVRAAPARASARTARKA